MRIENLVVGPIQTNCYILIDESSGVSAIIDPGAESSRIMAKLEETGTSLQYILLTHGHFDHFTGVRKILERYDVPVYINEKDTVEKSTSSADLQMPRLDEAHQRYYSEGDVLSLGNLSISVLETPGHSRGSVCLVVDDVIFSGDTLFRGSCGRTDFVGGNFEEIQKSLKRLAELPGEYHVYPGHDVPTTMSFERQYNPFMR